MAVQTHSGPHLVDLSQVDSRLVIEARYSRSDNFVGRVLYPENRLFLLQTVAHRVAAINSSLRESAVRLKIWDAYRPHAVQRRMWDLVPDERYVANPAKGSNHNRGCAVDVTLVRDDTGAELPMGSGFDDFTEKSHRDYKDLSHEERRNRQLLEDAFRRHQFVPFPTEWWHFDAAECQEYPVLDVNPYGRPLP